MCNERTLKLIHASIKQCINIAAVFVKEELTRPADAQVETALRENSSTIREKTLEPIRERTTVRIQNWRADLQFPLRGVISEDDLGLLPFPESESLCAEKKQ